MSMTTAYTSGKLLISILDRSNGDYVVQASKQAGARGGTILLGRGTADSALLRILCLGDTEKDLVLTLAPAEEMAGIVAALRSDERIARKSPGIGFILDVAGILRHIGLISPHEADAVLTPQTDARMKEATHELICVIVNSGYADDLMNTARKAGARGGTILHARGTGTEEDVKFFGITLVPEKEMLLVLTEKDQAAGILDAIRKDPCLNEPGIGIAFCMDVESFFPLGGQS
jgi:nitrogen regulatory protein PII